MVCFVCIVNKQKTYNKIIYNNWSARGVLRIKVSFLRNFAYSVSHLVLYDKNTAKFNTRFFFYFSLHITILLKLFLLSYKSIQKVIMAGRIPYEFFPAEHRRVRRKKNAM